MIGEVLNLGERLAGKRSPRLRRGLFFAVGEAMATAAPYALVLNVVKRALEQRLDAAIILWTTAAIACAAVVRTAFARAAMANIFIAAHELMGQTRIRAADHLRRLPMGFFTARRSGELAGVLTTDMALVEDIWSHLLGIFAASFALPVIVGLGLCFLDLRLGLAVLATLPLALAILGLSLPLFTREIDSVLDASADVTARVTEYVQGIVVLRVFGRYGDVFRRLNKAMEKLRDALIRADVLPSPLLSAFGFTIEAGFVLVAFLGARLASGGSIPPGTLLVFLVVTVGVLRQVAELGTALLMLRGSQRGLKRIDNLFAEAPLAETGTASMPARFDVVIDDVSFAYEREDGARALDHVSATFPARSLTAIVGPSGSGKSTLVHLVARLWDVRRGQGVIRIGGVDIRDLPFEDLHRCIAMVFQDVVLFSGTILENLRIGWPDASLEDVEEAARAAQAHDFIMALPDGYDTVLSDGGNTLSGGERQRLSIARAILKDAPIILLDEATASVDASAEADIQRALDELTRDKTVVVIAHRLRTVQLANHIIVMQRGKVTEAGSHQSLLAYDGLYAALWREQERAKGWTLAPA